MIIRTISILCLSFSLFCGEADEQVKLPASVQSILNKAESAVQKNRTAYDAANEKAFAETEKQLKAELDKLTKAGKLEEAMAVKKTMESFRTEVVAKVDESVKNKENQDLLGDQKFKIIEAKYGIGNKWIDCKEYVLKKLKNSKTFQHDDEIWRTLGDPLPGLDKFIVINYINSSGKSVELKVAKWQMVEIN